MNNNNPMFPNANKPFRSCVPNQVDLHSRITCKMCGTVFYPPIFLCINGHSLCTRCLSQCVQCVQCSGQITSRRNINAETLYDQLRVPCKNRAAGCGYEALGRSMRLHNDVCEFAFKPCPVPGCPWRGEVTAITKHFLDAHKSRMNN